MEVTLLGTGDTTGTPTPNCHCDTCRAARTREIERSRFSVHVHNERTGESLLIDASPDFRHQFLRADVALPDAAVITHIHFDHLDGLGNAYRLLDSLAVHAANEEDPATGASVAETVRADYDYLDRISIHPQGPYEPFEACGFRTTLVPVDHPPLLCYGVVVTDPESGATLAISGDTTYGIPAQSRAAMGEPDLLLADGIVPAAYCQYHPAGGDHHDSEGIARTFGTKHMTIEGALALADDLAAEEARVVHLSHFVPVDRAFEEPLAVDGETYRL